MTSTAWSIIEECSREPTGNPPETHQFGFLEIFLQKSTKLVVCISIPKLFSVELEIQLIWSFARNPFWKSSAAGSWLLHHWRTKWYDSSLFLKDYENSSNRHSFRWDSMIIITRVRLQRADHLANEINQGPYYVKLFVPHCASPLSYDTLMDTICSFHFAKLLFQLTQIVNSGEFCVSNLITRNKEIQ